MIRLYLFSITLILASPPMHGQTQEACKSTCEGRYRSCSRLATTNEQLLACSRAYDNCSATCLILPPSPTEYDFGTLQPGSNATHVIKMSHNNETTSTLIASWEPPIKDNIGRFSGQSQGPFWLTYGQRWELRKSENQNVAVEFRPPDSGEWSATLDLWLDKRGTLQWVKRVTFKGRSGLSGNPAMFQTATLRTPSGTGVFLWNSESGSNALVIAPGTPRARVIHSVVDVKSINGQQAHEAHALDANRDGCDDLLFFFPVTGQLRLWLANCSTDGFSPVATGIDERGVNGAQPHRLSVLDMTADGIMDLLFTWGAGDGGDTRAFRGLGNGTFTSIQGQVIPPDWIKQVR